jgi:methionine-rich copper-binding protein CopC
VETSKAEANLTMAEPGPRQPLDEHVKIISPVDWILAMLNRQVNVMLCCFIATVLFYFVPASQAHARLLKSIPSENGEIVSGSKTLEFWFNELLEEQFNSVKVFAADSAGKQERKDFAKGKPRVDPKDKTHLIVNIEVLPPGEYIAEYRVLSRDGHSAPGRLLFKVVAAKR